MTDTSEVLPVEGEPEHIFLQPNCCSHHSYEGRQWCEDAVWEKCECEQPLPIVRYIRADLANIPDAPAAEPLRDDPCHARDRILKTALFDLEKIDARDGSYGGVLTADGSYLHLTLTRGPQGYRPTEPSREALLAENARLREFIAGLANNINIAGSSYDRAITAIDAMVSMVKSGARAALSERQP